MKKWKQVLAAVALMGATAGVARADRIVFSSPNADIMMMNVDGTLLRQVTQGPLSESEPDLRADGSRIVFVGITFDSSPAGVSYVGQGIYSVNSDGSQSKRLTPEGATNLGYPAWSPDGKEILFQGLLATELGRNQGVFLMNADGSNLRRLGETVGRSPAWSRDGQRIAYISLEYSGRQAINVIDRAGRLLHQIAWPKLSADLDWSPDGSWFYLDGFVVDGDGPHHDGEIYRVSYDGSVVQRLTHDLYNHSAPEVSPDGNLVICTWARSPYKFELRLMRSDGTGERSFPTPAFGFSPSWSTAPALVSLRPSVRIAAPANGSIANRLSEVRGVASDGNGVGDIESLLVILRHQDGTYWDGIAWRSYGSPLALTRSGTAWRVASALPSGAALKEGTIFAEAAVRDREGQSSGSTAAVRIDLTPPRVVLSSLAFNDTRSSLSGTWRDAGSIHSIFVQLRRGDGASWNGKAWQSAPFLLPATLSNLNATRTGGTFSLSSGLPLQRDLNPGMLLSILAIDRAGNRGGLQQKIGPPPSVPRS